MSEYLDTVREVERRIQKAEADVAQGSLPADLERPLGVPAAYADHAKLMFDLQVLAMQGDITRVFSFVNEGAAGAASAGAKGICMMLSTSTARPRAIAWVIVT